MALDSDAPFPFYADKSGAPLQGGSVYFGAAGQNPVTSAITVYWDQAGTQPAAQPIKVNNGVTMRNGAPARVWLGGSFSRLVLDSKGQQVIYEAAPPSSLRSDLSGSSGAALVGIGTSTVADELNAINLAAYADLRAYAGPTKSARVTGYLVSKAPSGIAGLFTCDDSDTTSADDGGTIIVAANGKRWKRLFQGPVSIKWFGAMGDNVSDDTAAFALAGTYLRTAGGGTLLLPPGNYLITDPFWAYGINRWELSGYGATIRSTSVSIYDAQKNAFNLNFPAEGGGSPPTWDSGDTGTLIATAERGASSVTCLTPAAAANFTVGKIYKITSRCIQVGGWPFNHAYYDFVTVTSVNASTGVITFSENLRNRHRSDDVEAALYTGAARIWAGNSAKGTDFTEVFVCKGVKFLNHASFATSGASFYGVKKLVLEDCRFNYLYLGEMETGFVRNCNAAIFEPDKHIYTLNIEGGNIDFFTQATGVFQLNVNGAVINRCSTLGPRNLNMDGNFISDKSAAGVSSTPAVVQIMSGFPVKSARFTSNTFSSTKTYTTSADKAGAVSCPRAGSVINAADFIINATNIQISKSAASVLGWLAAAVAGNFIDITGANTYAKVQAVYDDGTYYVVDVLFFGPTAGVTSIRSGYLPSLYMRGNDYANCNYRELETIKAITEEVEDQINLGSYSVTYDSGLLRTSGSNTPEGRSYMEVDARVYEAEVKVIRPYTGTDATLYLGLLAFSKYVDLKVAGVRIFNQAGSYGTAGTDDTGAIVGAYVSTATNYINQSKAGTGAVTPGGTRDQQALVEVTYRYSQRPRLTTQY